MSATLLPFPTTRHTTRRSKAARKAVPASRVQDLLREIVIAMHATRPVAKVRRKAGQ